MFKNFICSLFHRQQWISAQTDIAGTPHLYCVRCDIAHGQVVAEVGQDDLA